VERVHPRLSEQAIIALRSRCQAYLHVGSAFEPKHFLLFVRLLISPDAQCAATGEAKLWNLCLQLTDPTRGFDKATGLAHNLQIFLRGCSGGQHPIVLRVLVWGFRWR
jgi:hypothetical protein